MCMQNTQEGCVLREQLQGVKADVGAVKEDVAGVKTEVAGVKADVGALDSRLTQVEHDMGRMRSEAQFGFRSINTALDNLAHDFGERMNNFDKRIVEEKEKWGNTLRTILLWGAKALIIGALVAMGVNVWKSAVN